MLFIIESSIISLYALKDGGTALMFASQCGWIEVVEELMRHGCNIHKAMNVREKNQIVVCFVICSRNPRSFENPYTVHVPVRTVKIFWSVPFALTMPPILF